MKKIIATLVLVAVCATADVTDRIHKNAKEKWPSDYKMQQYEVKEQTDARNRWESQTRFSNVPTDVVVGIRERAENKWGDNFVMKVYELNEQVEAWKKLNKKN